MREVVNKPVSRGIEGPGLPILFDNPPSRRGLTFNVPEAETMVVEVDSFHSSKRKDAQYFIMEPPKDG